jgi:hypothetical protein
MLALTSNEGAFDFQTLQWMKLEAKPNRAELKNYIKSLETSNLGKIAKTLCMLLAPLKEYFTEVRKIVPNSFY